MIKIKTQEEIEILKEGGRRHSSILKKLAKKYNASERESFHL